MKTFSQLVEELSRKDLMDTGKFAQSMFNKCKNYNIKFNTGPHFYDRINDSRNEQDVTVASVIRIFKKGAPKICKNMEEYIDHTVCLMDRKTFLNIPLTITDDIDGNIHIRTNSAQNKKDYWLPRKQIPIYIN